MPSHPGGRNDRGRGPARRAPAMAAAIAAAIAAPPLPALADAKTIGTLAGDVAAQLPAVIGLVSVASMVAGTLLVAFGLLRLRVASSSNGEVRYAEGIWKLAVGAGLAVLPAAADALVRSAALGSVAARALQVVQH